MKAIHTASAGTGSHAHITLQSAMNGSSLGWPAEVIGNRHQGVPIDTTIDSRP